MDIYLGYRRIDAEALDIKDADVLIIGAKIAF